jgi:type IV pilus assembly protein PilM
MATGADWQGKIKRLPSVSLSDLSPFKREDSYVAVDIGSSSIKVLEVRTAAHQLEVLNWGSVATPASAIQSNMVVDPARVAEAVQALVESRGVRARKAITAVPGPAVMIKRVTLPAQSDQELANTIMFEAGNFIPEELENVNLDYQVVGQLEEAKQTEVLLVAAKKDIVSSYAETLRAAGLTPVVVDVDYFALDNMYELNYEPVPDRVVALVNIGARYSSINILKGGRSMFTGDVPVGGRDITEALTRDLGLSAEDAERAKIGEPVAGVDREQLSFTLGPAVDALIEEIHYALSFFWTAATDERIDALYVSGGASHTTELAPRLAARAEASVDVADPFGHIVLSPSVDAQALRKRGPEFAVATGLASRRPGDK